MLMLKIKIIYFNIFLIEKYYTPHYRKYTDLTN